MVEILADIDKCKSVNEKIKYIQNMCSQRGKWAKVVMYSPESPTINIRYGNILSDGTHEIWLGKFTISVNTGKVTHVNNI